MAQFTKEFNHLASESDGMIKAKIALMAAMSDCEISANIDE